MKNPWRLLGTLTEPQRRRLYDYVRSQPGPVTREEAAAACGISHKLAAFHLDKLFEVGLLDAVTASATSSRRGRGRPPKAYVPTQEEVALSVPERRYVLLGEILVDTVATGPDEGRQAALSAARRRGAELARRCDRRDGDSVRSLTGALEQLGAEPQQPDPGHVVLGNCPFRKLANRQPELVCQMCRGLCESLTDGLGLPATVLADPAPGRCCVVIAL